MNTVVSIDKSRGFTRMDNEVLEALIGADLSAREFKVALAIHRLTAGYNAPSVKVAALYLSKMMYGDDAKAEAERANVSRAINSLIRQKVLSRAGGSRDPIGFAPVSGWKIDPKATVSKSTQSVEKHTATVLEITHIKERNTNTNANALVVAAVATTPTVAQAEVEPKTTTTPVQPSDRVPYAKIVDLYNRTCGAKLPQCLKLNDKRKKQIKACWNLEINGQFPFRSADFWEGYFNDCLANKHWIGENDRGWTADIEFLTRQDKVLKVLEAL